MVATNIQMFLMAKPGHPLIIKNQVEDGQD